MITKKGLCKRTDKGRDDIRERMGLSTSADPEKQEAVASHPSTDLSGDRAEGWISERGVRYPSD